MKLLDYITDVPLIEGTKRTMALITADTDLSALFKQGAAVFRTSKSNKDFKNWLEANEAFLESKLSGDAACFSMVIFAAVFPELLQTYERRGIPESISTSTLEDFDVKGAEHYSKFKRGGLQNPEWFVWHMKGRLFQIGRLQYIMNKGFSFDSDVLPPNTDVLDIHIPGRGRLTPVDCQKSMNDAIAFANRYFPERNYKAFTLCSWLLDEQLYELLPPDSNMVKFAQRFTRLPGEYGTQQPIYNRIFGFDKQQEAYKSHTAKTTLQCGAHKLLNDGRWFKNEAGFILI